MASIPQRQPSQRRGSPEQTSRTSPASQSQRPSSPVRARSATSEDSQTLYVGDKQDEQQEKQSQVDQASTSAQVEIDDPNVKKCWICFADSTEDTPETSPWRDPCPCALVAHEECLLDWIADMEAPNKSRSRSIGAPQIQCPQCKSEIKLARPKNYVVDAVRGIERIGARAVTPGAVIVLTNLVGRASLAHGMHSVYRIFGADDGYRILRPLVQQWAAPPIDLDLPADQMRDVLVNAAMEHIKHWRLYVGLPLITPMLILSRTQLADSILPVLPILFFATQTHTVHDDLNFTKWPPSASMAFALLPYLRSAYNAYYQRVWAEKETRWLKEIQPRSGQAQNEGNADGEAGDADQRVEDVADHEHIFEVRIDGGIWEEDFDDEDEQADQARQDMPNNAPLPPQQAPQDQQGDQAAPAPNVPDNRPPQNAGQQEPQPNEQPAGQQQAQPNNQAPGRQQDGGRRLSFSPTAIAETVLGALIFPTIAELSGELIRLTLPKSWTSMPTSSFSSRPGVRIGAKGLLQEKWGRSLVGGCLFVVFKDALMLYVRWKMAQMHRRRRVLDCDKSKKTVRS